jgi:hypothetical protein
MEENMFKRGHTIHYWFSDKGNHAYMDDEGKVYSVTHNKNDNKPTEKVKPMSYFKTKIAIMSVIIITLWTCIAMATENKTYQAVIASPQLNPNLVTALEIDVKWTNIKSLENIIITFNTVSPAKAAEDYKYYLKIGDVVKVKPGYYAVKFIKEFQGFYLYEVLGIVERS